ncbi:YdgA family protein [Lacimicrobium sp. SS2-24]|uniref:YdgA family protein n=1 Tax=Lacimicrobium sp. SS2-24 TaxID=2005569 RepID=UPI000B4B8B64|nr:YdgA family protein [Lacimicrobium sp. SS2-24]
MKKGFIIGGTVVVAALLIAPKYIATQVEKSLHQQIEQINQLPGYQAEITELQQHWFSSQAMLTLEMDLHDMGAAEADSTLTIPPITIDVTVDHGPLILSPMGTVGIAGWHASITGEALKTHLSWPQQTPFYQIEGVTSLTGNTTFEDKLSAFKGLPDSALASLDFSGYIGSGELSSDAFTYHGEAGSLTLEDEHLKLDSQRLSVTMEAETDLAGMLRGDFYDSDILLTLGRLHVQPPQSDQSIELNELKVRAQTHNNPQQQTGAMTLDYRLDELKTPEFDASELQLVLEAREISLDFLRAYQEFARNLPGQNADEINQLTQAFLFDNLLALLKTEPEVNITTLKGTIPGGKMSGQLNSKLVGIERLPDNIADRTFWLQHALADAELSIDKDAAEWLAARQMLSQLKARVPAEQWDQVKMQELATQQAPVMLDNFTQQGILKATNEGYETRFSIKEGEAQLNGTVIPLPQ